MKSLINKQLQLLCVLLLLTSGCKASTDINYKADTNDTNNTFGYSFGMFHESSIDEHETYYKIIGGNDNTFTPELMIDNELDIPSNYRIFALNNFNQQLMTFENLEHSYLDLKLEPFEKKTFNITLNVDQGANSIVVVCIREPDRILREKQYVSSNGVYALRRAVVINQPETTYSIQTNELFENISVNDKSIQEEDGIIAPHIVLDDDTELQTRIPSSYSGSLNLIVGNSKPNTKYAVISIIGDQILSNNYPFIQVNEPGVVELDLIDLPLEGKLNKNLVICVIENPFSLDSEEVAYADNRFVNIITLSE
ncbi:hypothetical protein LC085_21185 [Bacillus tianshenii]|uniref:hypothetical protein n=1 Tax=Sutcliffiella tianshenii TaxID=1463404 RepID=UPI001CD46EC6|nr:hypothetical protein [Bacillus tianshenii]MCA1322396.1 hypothetical protein [Bacillus tianshenii]